MLTHRPEAVNTFPSRWFMWAYGVQQAQYPVMSHTIRFSGFSATGAAVMTGSAVCSGSSSTCGSVKHHDRNARSITNRTIATVHSRLHHRLVRHSREYSRARLFRSLIDPAPQRH